MKVPNADYDTGHRDAEVEALQRELTSFKAWATPKIEMVTWSLGAAVGVGAILGALATAATLYVQIHHGAP